MGFWYSVESFPVSGIRSRWLMSLQKACDAGRTSAKMGSALGLVVRVHKYSNGLWYFGGETFFPS